jgi:rhodanese-related sulfurtransferase
MRKLLLALTLALGTTLAIAAERFADISTDELKKLITEKKVTLIDVNGTESWEKGHIPGALNFEQAQSKLADRLPADKNALIVAYCGNEQCPAYRAGAQAAKKLGYKNIRHYAKGIQGWVKAGEPTEKKN